MVTKKVKTRFFTDKEVKDFRRLCKVYNYKNTLIEREEYHALQFLYMDG